MTFKAREAINHSDVVVGYKTYIKLIESFLCQKEVVSTGMGAEVERVKMAISLAKGGKSVSLVSSGDTGIYGRCRGFARFHNKGAVFCPKEGKV